MKAYITDTSSDTVWTENFAAWLEDRGFMVDLHINCRDGGNDQFWDDNGNEFDGRYLGDQFSNSASNRDT